jgi:hypothetical protein
VQELFRRNDEYPSDAEVETLSKSSSFICVKSNGKILGSMFGPISRKSREKLEEVMKETESEGEVVETILVRVKLPHHKHGLLRYKEV